MSVSDGNVMWWFAIALGGALSVAVNDLFALGWFGRIAVGTATIFVVYYVVQFAYRQAAEAKSDETA